MGKYCNTDTDLKKTGVAILKSDKGDIRTKKMAVDKDKCLILIKVQVSKKI
jgi:hypothetical protein